MNFINELTVASIALYFLVIALLIANFKERQGWYLLGIVFILTSFSILRLSLVTNGKLLVYFPFFVFPSFFLLGPLVSFYTRTILFAEKIILAKNKKILLPVVLGFFAHTCMYILFEEFRDAKIIQEQVKIVRFYTYTLTFVAGSYNLCYYFLAWKRIKSLKSHMSQETRIANPIHVFYIKLIIETLSTLTFMSMGISLKDMWNKTPQFPTNPTGAILSLFLGYVFVFYYMKKPLIPSTQKQIATKQKSKYAKQNLTVEKRGEYLAQLEHYFQEKKPYLEENLTLDTLAKRLDIPSYHLSMVINIEKEQNFFQFTNAWRVEEAKKLLLNPQNHTYTILDIAFRSGFNSKSVFNRVFKESTG
ncbi:MAG: AraC family transcriptional regulator, partial [Spirochaetota bacterium]